MPLTTLNSDAPRNNRMKPNRRVIWKRMYLTRLSYSSPKLHRADDGGEVVVGQNHDRGFFGHIGASDAHRHADVGFLEGGCVVDAVTGHRRDVAGAFEHFDQPHLVFGGDARDHADVVDLPARFLVAHGARIRRR